MIGGHRYSVEMEGDKSYVIKPGERTVQVPKYSVTLAKPSLKLKWRKCDKLTKPNVNPNILDAQSPCSPLGDNDWYDSDDRKAFEKKKAKSCHVEGMYLPSGEFYTGLGDAIKHADEGVKIIGIMACCHGEKILGNRYYLDVDTNTWRQSPQRLADEDRYVIGISSSLATETALQYNFTPMLTNCLNKEEYNKPFLNVIQHIKEASLNFGNARKNKQNIGVTCSSKRLDLSKVSFNQLFSNDPQFMPLDKAAQAKEQKAAWAKHCRAARERRQKKIKMKAKTSPTDL